MDQVVDGRLDGVVTAFHVVGFLQHDLTDHVEDFHRYVTIRFLEEGIGDREVGRVRIHRDIGVRLVAVNSNYVGVAEVTVDIDLLQSIVYDALADFAVEVAVMAGLGSGSDTITFRAVDRLE